MIFINFWRGIPELWPAASRPIQSSANCLWPYSSNWDSCHSIIQEPEENQWMMTHLSHNVHCAYLRDLTAQHGPLAVVILYTFPAEKSPILSVYYICIFDMDMSYTRVLHIKVAYRVPHKWRHAFYVTRPLLCARITCYVTAITHGRCYAGA
jgi:hypothetical protein